MVRNLTNVFIGAFIWLACVSQAFASLPSDDLLKEANQLYQEFKDGEALKKFQMVLTQQPNSYEALYKICLLDLRIGSRFTDETQKLQFFTAAKEHAQKALEVNPQGADAHFVMAAALSNLSMVTGFKDRIVNLKSIKKHLDQALAYNPQHAAAWQLLGRWHYKVANLNVVECAASNFLMGGAPVGASNYNAIESLQKSLQYDPQNISSYYDLAIIYRDMKNKEKSISILEKAVKLQLVTSDDLELSRRCKAMLNSYGIVMV